MNFPTLVMPDQEDRTVSLWQRRKLLEVFPNSRRLPIHDCGHVAYLEHPDVFFATLWAFTHAKRVGFKPPL